MSSDTWFPIAFVLPLAGAVDVALARTPAAARRGALVTALTTFVSTLALFIHTLWAPIPVPASAVAGGVLDLRLDGASGLLATTTALVTLGALAFSSKRQLNARLASAVLAGEAGTMLALVSTSPWLFLLGWSVATVPLLASRIDPRASRLAAIAASLSIALAGFAVSIEAIGRARGWPETAGLWGSAAWIVAALVRAGAPPLHGWAPVALHRAPIAAAIPTVMSPLPLLVLARLFSSDVDLPAWSLAVLCALGAGGALYGALLAIVQHELKRAVGYFHVSLVGSLVAAVATRSDTGIAGALLAVVTGSFALSGLAFHAAAIEARTGTGDMRRLGGLHRDMPVGAAIFLVSGLAFVGFPGTIGFVSEDLVVQGLLPGHPVIAVLVLVATAVNGVTMFRCFGRTFLGPPASNAGLAPKVEDLLVRERITAMLWAGLLVAGGLVPAPLSAIQSTLRSSEAEPPAAATDDGHAVRSRTRGARGG